MDLMELLKDRSRAKKRSLKDKVKAADILRVAEDAGNQALKFRSLGGKSLAVPGSDRASQDYDTARSDLDKEEKSSESKQRQLLNRLDKIKSQEKSDERYKKEWDYKLDKDKKQEESAQDRLDFSRDYANRKLELEKIKYNLAKSNNDKNSYRKSAEYKAGFKSAEKSATDARESLGKLEVFSSELNRVKELSKSNRMSDLNESYRLAETMLRNLNTLGTSASDAVGKEEVERLAPELRRSLTNIINIGSLRDINKFVNKVQEKIKATGIAQEHLYNKATEELRSEKFGNYEPDYYGREKGNSKKDYKEVLDDSGSQKMYEFNGNMYPLAINPETGEYVAKIPEESDD